MPTGHLPTLSVECLHSIQPLMNHLKITFIGIALGAVLCLSGAPAALAETQPEPAVAPAASKSAKQMCPFCAAALKKDATYPEKAGNTLVRGAINFGFGWTELFLQPTKEVESGGNVITGMANGIGRTVSRTFSGLGEMLTFWTPKVDGQYIHFIPDCPLDTTGK